MVEIVSIYPEHIPLKWDEYRTKPVAAFKTPKDEPISSQQVTIHQHLATRRGHSPLCLSKPLGAGLLGAGTWSG